MTTPGLVLSTDISTSVSISLILPHKMRSLYWLPNTISRDSIWKLTSHLNTRSLVNLGISFENRCPHPPPAEAQFSTHILTLSRMRGKLGKAWATSPQHRRRRTNRRRNSHKCSATCLTLFLSILKSWAKRVHRLFQRCCPILQFWGNQYNSHYNNMCACYGVWFPKTRPCNNPDTWLDLISFSITHPILEVENDQEAGSAWGSSKKNGKI